RSDWAAWRCWWLRSTSPVVSSSRSACSRCFASEGHPAMTSTIRALAYLLASLLFILSLRGLSTQETAIRGNRYGLFGMVIAVICTAVALLFPEGEVAAAAVSFSGVGVLAGALGVGSVIGGLLASRVAMT